MATLEQRIEALEQRITAVESTAYFIATYDTVPLGWSFGDGGARVEIMRLSDESDAELQTRAATAARAARPGNPAILFQVTDHEYA